MSPDGVLLVQPPWVFVLAPATAIALMHKAGLTHPPAGAVTMLMISTPSSATWRWVLVAAPRGQRDLHLGGHRRQQRLFQAAVPHLLVRSWQNARPRPEFLPERCIECSGRTGSIRRKCMCQIIWARVDAPAIPLSNLWSRAAPAAAGSDVFWQSVGWCVSYARRHPILFPPCRCSVEGADHCASATHLTCGASARRLDPYICTVRGDVMLVVAADHDVLVLSYRKRPFLYTQSCSARGPTTPNTYLDAHMATHRSNQWRRPPISPAAWSRRVPCAAQPEDR